MRYSFVLVSGYPDISVWLSCFPCHHAYSTVTRWEQGELLYNLQYINMNVDLSQLIHREGALQ